MQQRQATHFINYNMRQRRNGQKEISNEEFDKKIWKSFNSEF